MPNQRPSLQPKAVGEPNRPPLLRSPLCIRAGLVLLRRQCRSPTNICLPQLVGPLHHRDMVSPQDTASPAIRPTWVTVNTRRRIRRTVNLHHPSTDLLLRICRHRLAMDNSHNNRRRSSSSRRRHPLMLSKAQLAKVADEAGRFQLGCPKANYTVRYLYLLS